MSRVVFSLGFIVLLSAVGCEPPGPDPDAVTAEPEPPSLWHDGDGTFLASLPVEDPELLTAMENARSEFETAMQDWQATPEEHRSWWGVKWAARCADGSIEYVWVEPEAWSPFRVEGILTNEPLAALECGRTMGERVSFPSEELVDWVFLSTGSLEGPRKGGFTMDVLEDRYGQP